MKKPASSSSSEVAPVSSSSLADLQKTLTYRIVWSVITFFASVFWLYTLVKLFVFDVDVYLIKTTAPDAVWILNYKSFVFLGLLASLFLLGVKEALSVVIYVVFFPFLVALWKLPRFLFRKKSWVLALAILNALIGFFQTFRRNLLVATLWSIAMAVAVSASDHWVLFCSSACLMMILLSVYKATFVAIFHAPPIFQTYKKMFAAVRSHLNTASLPERSFTSQAVVNLSQEEQKKWASKIEFAHPLQSSLSRCCAAAQRISEQWRKFSFWMSAFAICNIYHDNNLGSRELFAFHCRRRGI